MAIVISKLTKSPKVGLHRKESNNGIHKGYSSLLHLVLEMAKWSVLLWKASPSLIPIESFFFLQKWLTF